MAEKEDQKIVRGKGHKAEADKVPQARTSTATNPDSAPNASSTNASTRPSTSARPTKSKNHFQVPCNPIAPNSSMSVSNGDVVHASSTPAKDPGGAGKRHPFFSGRWKISDRYPVSRGWCVRDYQEPIEDKPICLCKGWASILVSYGYSKFDERNGLPHGFTLTPQYAKVIAEALYSGLEKNLWKGVVQLSPDHSLVATGRVWNWSVHANYSKPERAWQFLKQQFDTDGLRHLLADYIECMSQVEMQDGRRSANCLVFHFAKYVPDDLAEQQQAQASTASTGHTECFPELPAEKDILDITLELVHPRRRSVSPFIANILGRPEK